MLSKEEVKYEHPAKEMNDCDDCIHFQVKHFHGCEIVKGTILPEDWCNRFERDGSKLISIKSRTTGENKDLK